MDNLRQAMQLIDECTDILPEGIYMKLCSYLKNVYNKHTEPVYFFNHDNMNDRFRSRSIQLDRDFIYGQLIYLEKDLENYKPVKRITKLPNGHQVMIPGGDMRLPSKVSYRSI